MCGFSWNFTGLREDVLYFMLLLAGNPQKILTASSESFYQHSFRTMDFVFILQLPVLYDFQHSLTLMGVSFSLPSKMLQKVR
jgi:hypothetical protein